VAIKSQGKGLVRQTHWPKETKKVAFEKAKRAPFLTGARGLGSGNGLPEYGGDASSKRVQRSVGCKSDSNLLLCTTEQKRGDEGEGGWDDAGYTGRHVAIVER